MTKINNLPPAPSPADTQEDFDAKSFNLLSALDQFVTETNAVGAEAAGSASAAAQRVVDAQARVDMAAGHAESAKNSAESAVAAALNAEATANFKGDWSALAGSISRPATVRHDGMMWVLMQDLADITDHEPGGSAAWSISPSYALIYAAL